MPKAPLTNPPEDLTPQQKKQLMAWCRAKFPQYAHRNPGGLRDLVDACNEWHIEHKIKRSNWKLTYMNWVRKQREIEWKKEQTYKAEHPQYQVQQRSDEGLEEIGEVIRLFKDPLSG